MSSRSVFWRRLGIGAVALATAAAGLPLLLAAPAQAADTARLVLTPGAQTVAAGTCALFTITPVDSSGLQASDTPTVLVKATENPQDGTQDVDFCEIPGVTTTPVGGSAFYYNGVINRSQEAQTEAAMRFETADAPRTRQAYVPGTGVTPDINGNSAGGVPDGPGNTDEQPDTPFASRATNPNGQDFAQFRVSSGGQIKFGLVGLRAGTPGASVEAYVERQTINDFFPPTRSGSENDPTPALGTLTFTNGGAAGSQQAADAVTTLDAEPEDDVAVVGTTKFFTALLKNNTGETVAGVTPVVRVAGPNSNSVDQIRADCGRSDNNGLSTCAFQGRNVGTDTLTVFVNRTSGTAGPDGSEAQDNIVRTTAAPANQNSSQARQVELTPDTVTTAAGQTVTFTATVIDANGTRVQGVTVTFTKTGPGSFVGGATAPTAATDQTGRASIATQTGAGQTGNQTVTATLSTVQTDCELPAGSPAGSTAGRCSDTSTNTVVAVVVSPSPTPSAATGVSPRPSTSATASASPSASATSTAPSTADSRYRGLASPVRVLDTRNNNGIRRSGEIVLDLSQRLNDAEATAAVLNVTVTNPTARGFLVAYPNGNTKPGTSNVNFETNQTQANEVVVGLSSTKRVSLFVDSASAHVIVDLVGSFTRDTGTDTGRVVTNAPVRAFDSRTTATPRRTGEVVVDLSSRLPDGATDAILNVTVQGPGARGYVVVYPSGTTRPGTSNVNFERGQTQANEVVTRVGTGGNAGRVSLFIDSASSALIVDVVGAVVSSATGAQSFTALEQPVRALDTRSSNGARRSGEVTVAMPSSVPSGATGVILNVTATNGTRSGFVAVYPAGAANPGTSNVNFPTNLTQANEVTTRLGSNRSVTLFVGGSGTPAAHLIVDVVGYLTS